MRYRIPLPLSSSTGDPRLDIVDPTWEPESRALAQHGLSDVEASTNAMVLALLDHHPDQISFVDVGAGIGISSMLCATLVRPKRIVAVEERERPASMLRRIATANDLDIEFRSELAHALGEVGTGSSLVVRVGTTVDATAALDAVRVAPGGDPPPVVIVGDRDRTTLRDAAEAGGYLAYPLQRFPSWRPLRDESNTVRADGWLLAAGTISDEVRERHSTWAGALGACTPDRNDRHPILVELRSGLRARHGAAQLLADARHDVGRTARAIWQGIDPWLPAPRSRTGRVVGRVVAVGRRLVSAAERR